SGKIALSTAESTLLDLERLRKPEQLQLQRSDFDAAVDHLVQSVEQTVLSLLQQAGLKADDIDSVFFTGGSSGVRLLRERIAALAPNARHVEGDLFGSIGSGLAIDAARKFG
ncbi:MAG: Hsp70 family protein, partial [Herbaspirillum sp.]|nr:Hsp70 family protein [Herbaspirillum sp.]